MNKQEKTSEEITNKKFIEYCFGLLINTYWSKTPGGERLFRDTKSVLERLLNTQSLKVFGRPVKFEIARVYNGNEVVGINMNDEFVAIPIRVTKDTEVIDHVVVMPDSLNCKKLKPFLESWWEWRAKADETARKKAGARPAVWPKVCY